MTLKIESLDVRLNRIVDNFAEGDKRAGDALILAFNGRGRVPEFTKYENALIKLNEKHCLDPNQVVVFRDILVANNLVLSELQGGTFSTRESFLGAMSLAYTAHQILEGMGKAQDNSLEGKYFPADPMIEAERRGVRI